MVVTTETTLKVVTRMASSHGTPRVRVSQTERPKDAAARKPRYQRICVSAQKLAARPWARLMKRTKGMPPNTMKTTRTHSMAGLFQPATDASRVEKPPVDTAVIAWLTASNQDIPA